MFSNTLRINVESSTTSTRIFLEGVAMVLLRHRRGRAWRLRSYELFNCRDQLILLHRFGQESRSAFLHGAIAVLGAGARCHDHHRNAPRGWALPQLHHQLVPSHPRHFEVGYDQVTAVLRNKFRGLEAVTGKLDAVAILFQHAPHEFAHADGVVGHDDDALRLDAIDGFGRNRAARHSRGAWGEDARGAGVGLQRPAICRFRSDHAVQVNQQNQAAVRCNSCTGEKLYAAEIFAQVLDYDFVFADNFFNDQADLMVSGVGHHHAEKAVYRLKRWQA